MFFSATNHKKISLLSSSTCNHKIHMTNGTGHSTNLLFLPHSLLPSSSPPLLSPRLPGGLHHLHDLHDAGQSLRQVHGLLHKPAHKLDASQPLEQEGGATGDGVVGAGELEGYAGTLHLHQRVLYRPILDQLREESRTLYMR